MGRRIDYDTASAVLADSFELAEVDFRSRTPIDVPATITTACDALFASATQAFRYNNRKMTDSERFSIAVNGIIGKRLTYDNLTGNAEWKM